MFVRFTDWSGDPVLVNTRAILYVEMARHDRVKLFLPGDVELLVRGDFETVSVRLGGPCGEFRPTGADERGYPGCAVCERPGSERDGNR